jgi:hypothetical protein
MIKATGATSLTTISIGKTRHGQSNMIQASAICGMFIRKNAQSDAGNR